MAYLRFWGRLYIHTSYLCTQILRFVRSKTGLWSIALWEERESVGVGSVQHGLVHWWCHIVGWVSAPGGYGASRGTRLKILHCSWKWNIAIATPASEHRKADFPPKTTNKIWGLAGWAHWCFGVWYSTGACKAFTKIPFVLMTWFTHLIFCWMTIDEDSSTYDSSTYSCHAQSISVCVLLLLPASWRPQFGRAKWLCHNRAATQQYLWSGRAKERLDSIS